MLIKRVSFAKPLAKAKHMVKTVRNMFDKKQKVPFQPLTPDMLGISIWHKPHINLWKKHLNS